MLSKTQSTLNKKAAKCRWHVCQKVLKLAAASFKSLLWRHSPLSPKPYRISRGYSDGKRGYLWEATREKTHTSYLSPMRYAEKICHVEKFQIFILDRCEEIWNFSTCGEVSKFSTRPLLRNLKCLHIWHVMWRIGSWKLKKLSLWNLVQIIS